mgnify:CR=1 FL=1
MKKILIYCLLLTYALMARATDDQDSLYVYASLADVIEGVHSAVVVDPIIEAESPWEVYFGCDNPKIDKMITYEAVAVALGDSVWMLNTRYLNRYFRGSWGTISGYVPMLFNDKVLMFEYATLTRDVFGNVMDDPANITPDLYWVDLEDKAVYYINNKTLSVLLERYHDLQMRYDGMKDRKKRRVINYFLNELIERMDNDPDVPTLDTYRIGS